MSKPIITVIAATSKQSSSVAITLAQSGKYLVRALVRNPQNPEVEKLKAKGIEIFVGDFSNKSDLEKAFAGAYAEFNQGKLFGDVAKASGVKHIVWSSLEDVDKITKSKYVVPHFTMKAKVQEYLESLSDVKVTSVLLAYFYTNIIEYYRPVKKEDGSLVFQLPSDPDVSAPFVDPVTAPGPVVLEVFNNPEKYDKRSIPVLGDEVSPKKMIEIFTKVTGIPAAYEKTPKEEFFKRFPPTLADEIWQMWEYSMEFGYFRKDRDLNESRKIDPNAMNFEEFLLKSGWKGESFQEWRARN